MKKSKNNYQPKVCILYGATVGTMDQLIAHMREKYQGKMPLKA